MDLKRHWFLTKKFNSYVLQRKNLVIYLWIRRYSGLKKNAQLAFKMRTAGADRIVGPPGEKRPITYGSAETAGIPTEGFPETHIS